uniref:Uncharacterized protein n=1 Tax=Dunaliella tertiolecta TaxID=3047 RepID=A0A7S3R8K4_DUNTE|mmetsp:Transcript_120/g.263  ORF Transcript_120/g.263 Transcript_120/m.263 type:complete len:145 (+) Transcript_120:168-602(+)|eukprot:CAMPEP_0202337340 /NCGR_PEP_ID=MMETSP1126-20121109/54_1 /ASSEMBLY_ACC=CAM_ASM_000457 /TAXON_ID=3047 /ORGANISM="Dunaliella tertiolecta, Strain CCMP1320" /LENGTH=144 /DNA_ID=CAMNT_0048927497 /DNA_START=214 /DNA_END=648 /DNA_ORIENTATION=+
MTSHSTVDAQLNSKLEELEDIVACGDENAWNSSDAKGIVIQVVSLCNQMGIRPPNGIIGRICHLLKFHKGQCPPDDSARPLIGFGMLFILLAHCREEMKQRPRAIAHLESFLLMLRDKFREENICDELVPLLLKKQLQLQGNGS